MRTRKEPLTLGCALGGSVATGSGMARLVTQLDDSLNQSLGSAPSAETPPTRHSRERGNPESPDPFDPSYIQSSIQDYILTITDNGRTIRTALIGIAFAGPENPAVTPYHRNRAATLLLDRILGTNPALALSRVEARPEHGPAPDAAERDRVEDLRSDEERWAKIEADLKQMEEAGILTPDPDAPPIDIQSPPILSTPLISNLLSNYRNDPTRRRTLTVRLTKRKKPPRSRLRSSCGSSGRSSGQR